MKSVNEIRLRLCFLIFYITLWSFLDCCLPGSGWEGLFNLILICMLGLVMGCFMTNLLIVFKKWWKE